MTKSHKKVNLGEKKSETNEKENVNLSQKKLKTSEKKVTKM